MIEPEIRIEIINYPGTTDNTGYPHEDKIYEATKKVDLSGNSLDIYDLFDEMKFDAARNIEDYVMTQCNHECLEDPDYMSCLVCGRTRAEIARAYK